MHLRGRTVLVAVVDRHVYGSVYRSCSSVKVIGNIGPVQPLSHGVVHTTLAKMVGQKEIVTKMRDH